MISLLEKINELGENTCNYFFNTCRYFSVVINNAYEYIYGINQKDENFNYVKSICDVTKEWLIENQNSKLYKYKEGSEDLIESKFNKEMPKDFESDMQLYGYDSSKNAPYGKTVNFSDDGFFSIEDNIIVNEYNEYDDKYSLFYSFIDCLCESLKLLDDGGTENAKNVFENYLKDYFYKIILKKYYEREIDDDTFSKLSIGALFKLMAKCYETLNGNGGAINYSKTIGDNKVPIRFEKTVYDSENKKINFTIRKEDVEWFGILNSAYSASRSLKNSNLENIKKYIIKNYIPIVKPIVNYGYSIKLLQNKYNLRSEDLRVSDLKIENNELIIIADLENNINIDRNTQGILKTGGITQRLLDNTVSNISSSNIVDFKNVIKGAKIKNPNIGYEAAQYNSFFDDRKLSYYKRKIISNNNIDGNKITIDSKHKIKNNYNYVIYTDSSNNEENIAKIIKTTEEKENDNKYIYNITINKEINSISSLELCYLEDGNTFHFLNKKES